MECSKEKMVICGTHYYDFVRLKSLLCKYMSTISYGLCGSLKPGKSWNSRISFSRPGKL